MLDDPDADMRQAGSAAKEEPLPQQPGGDSQHKLTLQEPIEYDDTSLGKY